MFTKDCGSYQITAINSDDAVRRKITDDKRYVTQYLRYRSTRMAAKLFHYKIHDLLQEMNDYHRSILIRQVLHENSKEQMIKAN